ncbi:ubiquitin carboxyl-terminal hydrolase [Anaeramoeba flamelloides]|uniref:Ubiquitin carboxyl-terminal hydrolase n=1 Tax=Anaeramoeba flamelloides TaxID=1746091 RepID=A0ABQ8YMR5_9EUKA|nr:ubiquitin carboxyl-terminal hydrolase [Anaeramoeba flamelloides]
MSTKENFNNKEVGSQINNNEKGNKNEIEIEIEKEEKEKKDQESKQKNKCIDENESQIEEENLTPITTFVEKEYSDAFCSTLLFLLHSIPVETAFKKNKFLLEINRTNKLGVSGVLVESFLELYCSYWHSNIKKISLSRFFDKPKLDPLHKKTPKAFDLAFVEYFLNVLHQDLNRITEVPSKIKYRKQGNRSFNSIGNEYWEKHQCFDDSLIEEMFAVQLKKENQCMCCFRNGYDFPIKYTMELELPKYKKNEFNITFIFQDPEKISTRYFFIMEEEITFKNFKKKIGKLSGISVNKILLVEIFHSRIYRKLESDLDIQNINGNEIIVGYELNNENCLGGSKKQKGDMVSIQIFNYKNNNMKKLFNGKLKNSMILYPLLLELPLGEISYQKIYEMIFNKLKYFFTTECIKKFSDLIDKERKKKIQEDRNIIIENNEDIPDEIEKGGANIFNKQTKKKGKGTEKESGNNEISMASELSENNILIEKTTNNKPSANSEDAEEKKNDNLKSSKKLQYHISKTKANLLETGFNENEISPLFILYEMNPNSNGIKKKLNTSEKIIITEETILSIIWNPVLFFNSKDSLIKISDIILFKKNNFYKKFESRIIMNNNLNKFNINNSYEEWEYITLIDILTDLYRKEKQEKKLQWECIHCGTKTLPITNTKMFLTSESIVFCIDRKFDSKNQNMRPIKFPMVLDLAPFILEKTPKFTKYYLSSFVVYRHDISQYNFYAYNPIHKSWFQYSPNKFRKIENIENELHPQVSMIIYQLEKNY